MRRTPNRRGRWFCTPPASSSEPKTKRIFIFLFFLGEGEEDGLRVVDDDLARQARLQKGEIRNDANESLAQCPGCPYGNLGETQGSNPNPNPFRRRKCRQCRDDSREREAEVQRKAAANPKRIRRLKQRQAQQLVAKKREAQREARLGPRE